ncbi:MAG: GspH/FimT family pseudopilin [Gammaproteobacteria bacterium]|nr:GspH/FimT family pseudopilin [Gammaproteobacteria bacterium]
MRSLGILFSWMTTTAQLAEQGDYVMKREGGFTLIELMIAVGLTALLLSMAVPAMSLFVSNARQTGAINDFVSSLHVARSTAITTNARVTVCPSAGGNDCEAVSWDRGWIVFRDPDSDQTVDADETIVAVSDGADGLTFQTAEFGQFLMYRPTGRVMNASINGNAGQFTVCDDRGASHAKVMIIELSGRPRTSEYLADGTPPSCP